MFISIIYSSVDSGPLIITNDWLPSLFILLAAGMLTRKQWRRLKWKIAWEMIKDKLRAKKGKKKGKVKWGLVIFFGLLMAGTLWLSFAAGIGGALIKTIGVFVSILFGLWIYGLIVGWWGLR